MAATRGIDVGMLVRSAAGKKLGEVQSLAPSYFSVRRGGLFRSSIEYAVRYDDVIYRRAGAVVIAPSSLHPLSELLAQTDTGISRRSRRAEPDAEEPRAPPDDDAPLLL